ncbi:hypothetical protein AVEN_75793-1 [Araneus ventricosus]|uniref:Uncharacterized protein n=1 Tax=Araneus ventricosus TaxID=182803 RepID=A0A4Y2K661_ARAVE|nr:hypothetical protein AVEN_75793-1 [Araneus ventricosus]
MARRTDAPDNSELRSVIRFLKQKVGLWKTINTVVSRQTLRRLRIAILTSGVVLIRDNARPHRAMTAETNEKSFNEQALLLYHFMSKTLRQSGFANRFYISNFLSFNVFASYDFLILY